MVVIVEVYAAEARAQQSARRAAAAIAREAPTARLLRSLVVPEDETAFLVFDGDLDDLRRAAERADMGSARVVEGIEAPPPHTSREESP